MQRALSMSGKRVYQDLTVSRCGLFARRKRVTKAYNGKYNRF